MQSFITNISGYKIQNKNSIQFGHFIQGRIRVAACLQCSSEAFQNGQRPMHIKLARFIYVSMITISNANIFRVTQALCPGIHPHLWNPVTHWPVTRSFGVFFDLCLNTRLNAISLWCHCNVGIGMLDVGWTITYLGIDNPRPYPRGNIYKIHYCLIINYFMYSRNFW